MDKFVYIPGKTILLSTGMAILLTGCSLFQVYDLTMYPENTRTIFLFNLSNATFQPDVNRELTEKLREEIQSRGNFVVLEERNEARYFVSGEVSAYRLEGRMYDDLRQPTRYTITASALIRMTRTGVGSEIVLGRELTARTDYSPEQGLAETELDARARVMRKLASSIASAMEEEYLSRREQRDEKSGQTGESGQKGESDERTNSGGN